MLVPEVKVEAMVVVSMVALVAVVVVVVVMVAVVVVVVVAAAAVVVVVAEACSNSWQMMKRYFSLQKRMDQAEDTQKLAVAVCK